MKRLFILVLIVMCIGLLPVSGLEKVSIRTQWVVQAQFAGYYVAQEKGFYAEEGLDVDVLPGSGDVNGLAEAARDKVNFATQWLSSGIQFKSNGMPIVCVAQIFPRSMLVLVSKKSLGINSIRDINKRKVGLWGGIFAAPIKALLRKNALRVSFVKEGFDMQPFVDGKYDQIGEVVSAMLYNEYNQIITKGADQNDLIVFNPGDYRANFPEDGIYVSQNYLNSNPEVVKKFVRATLKGWNYALKNQAEAIDIMMASGAADRAHQENMLKVIGEHIVRSNNQVGTELSQKEFNFVQKTLKDNDLLGKKPVKFKEFYQDLVNQ